MEVTSDTQQKWQQFNTGFDRLWLDIIVWVSMRYESYEVRSLGIAKSDKASASQKFRTVHLPLSATQRLSFVLPARHKESKICAIKAAPEKVGAEAVGATLSCQAGRRTWHTHALGLLLSFENVFALHFVIFVSKLLPFLIFLHSRPWVLAKADLKHLSCFQSFAIFYFQAALQSSQALWASSTSWAPDLNVFWGANGILAKVRRLVVRRPCPHCHCGAIDCFVDCHFVLLFHSWAAHSCP